MSERPTPEQRLARVIAERERIGDRAFEARVNRLRKLGHLTPREMQKLLDDERRKK